jgi:hypothetical protein
VGDQRQDRAAQRQEDQDRQQPVFEEGHGQLVARFSLLVARLPSALHEQRATSNVISTAG